MRASLCKHNENENLKNLKWTFKAKHGLVGSHWRWEKREIRLEGRTMSMGAAGSVGYVEEEASDSVWKKSTK